MNFVENLSIEVASGRSKTMYMYGFNIEYCGEYLAQMTCYVNLRCHNLTYVDFVVYIRKVSDIYFQIAQNL